jgi:hypothetical protein
VDEFSRFSGQMLVEAEPKLETGKPGLLHPGDGAAAGIHPDAESFSRLRQGGRAEGGDDDRPGHDPYDEPAVFHWISSFRWDGKDTLPIRRPAFQSHSAKGPGETY